MVALECRTTHGKLGFLDPQIINSRNIDQLGDKSEQAVVDYVYASFVNLHDKNTILLPYHFK